MQNKEVVLVDDRRSFKEDVARGVDVTTFRDEQGASNWIRGYSGHIAQLWLDHDLGKSLYGTPVTVIPFIRALIANKNVTVGSIFIHTSNKAAIARIRRELEELNSKALELPASEYLIDRGED